MLDLTIAKQSLRTRLGMEDPAQPIGQLFNPPLVMLINDPDLGPRSVREEDGDDREDGHFVDFDEPVISGGQYSVVLVHKKMNNVRTNDNVDETGEEASWLNLDPSSAVSSWTHDRAIRDRNKSYRRIYAEAKMDYGEDVKTKKQLTFREDVAVNLRKTKVANMVKLMKAARRLDLCFLVDVTGSMQPHIDAVKTSIRLIVDKLTTKDGHMKSIVKKIRLAFVGYRDFSDDKQFEVLPFTNSLDEFQKFCDAITAVGGGDAAEDVFGGLEKMIGLDWSVDGSTRMFFHIADCPCHGSEFNGWSKSDDYPNGDPRGRSIQALLEQLSDNRIQYYFGKINSNTDKMIAKFSEFFDGEIVVCDLANPDKLFENVVSSSSIAVTNKANPLGFGRRRQKQKDLFERAVPKWEDLPKISGILYSYQMPNSFKTIVEGFPLKANRPIKATIQIAPKPFAGGAERFAYYGRDVSNPSKPMEIVLKKYICESGKENEYLNSASHYESAIQMQTIAAYLAKLFNTFIDEEIDNGYVIKLLKTVVHISNGYPIKFLKTQVLSYANFSDGNNVFMSCEKRYPDNHNYLRFTNNLNYAMLEMTAKLKGVDMQFVNQLFAFSHWTYHVTRGYLMVVDLQGIISKDSSGKQVIELTDPAIHCTDLTRFGQTNLGEEGMKGFFSRHKCNKICLQLGLVVPEKFAYLAPKR